MSRDIIGYLYAGVVAAGGIFGYVKAGSVYSLGAGLLFGSILSYGAYQASLDAQNCYVSLLASGCLVCLMGYRYFLSGKIMPAGGVALLSLVMFIRYGCMLKGYL